MTQQDDEALVRGLMRETARAVLERDLAALDRVLDDQFTAIGLYTNHGGEWRLLLSSARVVPVSESPDH